MINKFILRVGYGIAIGVAGVFVAQAQNVSFSLWEKFPDNQGDNGVYAYAYSAGGGYRLLTDTGSFIFGTPGPGHPWDIPYIARQTDPQIVTHPYGSEYGWVEETRLLFRVPGDYTVVTRIYGGIDPSDGGDIDFFIYVNSLAVYNAHVGSAPVYFDVNVNAVPNDDIIFAVSPRGPGYYDTTFYWATFDAQVPEPSSMWLLIGVGMSCLLVCSLKRGTLR